MSKKKAANASSSTPATSRREMLRQQQEAEAKRQRMMRIVSIGAVVLAVAIAAIVGTVWWKDHSKKKAQVTAQGTPKNANADKTGIVLNPGKAKPGAPTLTIYADYQCPACKGLEAQYGPIFQKLADKGEINLDSRTMTFMQVNLANTASVRAAVGAACSDNFGIYPQYHQAVFENQAQQEVRGSEGYSDQLLRETIPTKLGLSGQQLTDFQACYDTKATEGFVQQVDEAAAKAGVTSTPTLAVNGKMLDLKTVQLGQTEESVLKAIQDNA